MLRVFTFSFLFFIGVPEAFAEAPLDTQKVIGKWCYTHTEIAGEKSEENIPYEFFDNGEFHFKNSSMASKTRTAKYKLEGTKLNIGALAPGGLTIISLTDDEMVATGLFSSKRYFKRGECTS